MDIVLDFVDEKVLTPYVYPASWPEDNMYRQFLSLWVIASLGGGLLYITLASLSYYFVFDHKLRQHPHFLKNQEMQEIQVALGAVPLMGAMTAFFFVAEVRGYSKLYEDPASYGGGPFLVLSFFSFLMFTDFCIYWIHRWLHIPVFYKSLHKLHHKWKIIPLCKPLVPLGRRLCAEPAVPPLPVHLPAPEVGLPRALHGSQHLDREHPRL